MIVQLNGTSDKIVIEDLGYQKEKGCKKKKKGNIQERPTKEWAEQPVNQHLGAEL